MSERDFLKRWSDRKLSDAPEPELETVAPTEPVAEVEEKTDEEILAEFGLKDPDQMDAGDDFSGFMNSAIPTRLRNRALRKLWTGNPVLANVDGLVEYGEDFTDAANVIENLQTAYQVGKGMVKNYLTDQEKEEKHAAARALEVVEPPEPEPSEEEVVVDAEPTLINESQPEDAQPEEDMAYQPPVRRRMTFRFDEA